ncbi:MAG: PA2779 family protein [Pseudomonadota bacterium]|nr:PA2779 family protein [Pseudomonadota bacterium]
MKIRTLKSVTTWMLATVFAFGAMFQQAYAAPQDMVTTEQLMQEMQVADQRASVNSFLSRADVQAQLAARGVDAADAQARVNAMSQAELAALSAQIDELPAGEGLLETVLFLLVIFMLLDIAGVTDIFPGL